MLAAVSLSTVTPSAEDIASSPTLSNTVRMASTLPIYSSLQIDSMSASVWFLSVPFACPPDCSTYFSMKRASAALSPLRASPNRHASASSVSVASVCCLSKSLLRPLLHIPRSKAASAVWFSAKEEQISQSIESVTSMFSRSVIKDTITRLYAADEEALYLSQSSAKGFWRSSFKRITGTLFASMYCMESFSTSANR